jgi:hypothetical protein
MPRSCRQGWRRDEFQPPQFSRSTKTRDPRRKRSGRGSILAFRAHDAATAQDAVGVVTFAREGDFVARKLRSHVQRPHVQRPRNARDNSAAGVALLGIERAAEGATTSRQKRLTAVGDVYAMPSGTSHEWGHSRSRFFQCHNYVSDNLLVRLRHTRCGIKDRFPSVSSTSDVDEADAHHECFPRS